MKMRFLLVLFLGSFALSSCGGGGGGSDSTPPTPAPVPTNAGGLWEGSTFNDQAGLTFETIGVVTENNGEGRFVNDQGQQFILNGISGTDGNISATITAIAPIGFTFVDGSTVTTGTLTGTVVERESLSGNWSLNTGETGTVTMSYNNLYERGSDLARTSGSWVDSFGVVYSIDAVGEIFAQDGLGCVYNGAVRIINASFNVYRVTLTISNCPGVDGNYSGLGVLADDVGMDDAFIVQLDNGELIITDLLLRPSSPPPAACSLEGQKQFVLDNMRAWYFWNDLLPAQVNTSQFATPEDLLAFLTTFSPDITPDDGINNPVDRFSFINTAAADQAFFGEGKFEGFGFSSRFVAENDLRLTRVFFDSPANRAGLSRGQRIVALNGRTIAEIEAAEGVNAVFDLPTLDFTMRPVGGNPDGSDDFTATITQDIVTIDPVPQARIITDPDGIRPPVGYMELATFISTADAQMDAVFADFRAQGINDVILDLRYNGGGLVSTSELLGDFLGGDIAENLVYSKTVFNELRAAANNSTEFFERRGNSMSLVRLVVIASRSTASASELVINGMDPHVEVVIVGDDTFGKPVGQVGLEFCEKILRPTAFQTLNANDFGDFFFGLPVDCAAPDDLDVAVGADNDPNIEAALAYLDTGACQVGVANHLLAKPDVWDRDRIPDLSGPPWRQFADAQ